MQQVCVIFSYSRNISQRGWRMFLKIYCPTTLQPAALLRVAAIQTSSRTVSREAFAFRFYYRERAGLLPLCSLSTEN